MERIQQQFRSACFKGDVEKVRAMIAEHPTLDVNFHVRGGEWPLRIAVERLKVEVVRVLVAHPSIDVNQITLEWDSALHRAVLCRGPHAEEILKLLLEHPKIDVNIRTLGLFDKVGSTPLEYAVADWKPFNKGHAIPMLLAHSNIEPLVRGTNGAPIHVF